MYGTMYILCVGVQYISHVLAVIFRRLCGAALGSLASKVYTTPIATIDRDVKQHN